jgi:hypothetical protein
MKKILSLLASFLLVFVTSCSLASTPEVIVVTATVPVETLVAQSVALTMAAQTAPSNPLPNDTPQFTFTPSLTPTLEFTSTSEVPHLTVTVQTNCRSGPGEAYDILGVMNVGETAEVIGRSAANNYYIIHLPSNPSITCTIWGQYATLTGGSSGLTVFNIPPTPTPKFTATPQASFQVEYSDMTNCPAAYWWFNFKFTNNGSVTWESLHIYLTDTVTAQVQDAAFDDFSRHNACDTVSTDLNMDPGEVGYTGYALTGGTPAGHSISATFKVCSQNGMAGTCLEKTITFTP